MTPNYSSPGMAGHRPQTEADEERGYLIGTWKDFPVFKCAFCPQDLFNEDEMKLHVFTRHVSPMSKAAHEAAFRPAQALLFDADGKKVEEIPVAQRTPPEEEVGGIPSDALLDAMIPELLSKGLIEDGTDDPR